jgi:hypothetical protein
MLGDVIIKCALVFFDDILIYSKNMKDHILHLSTVFSILQKNHVFARLKKCTFAQSQVEYLGHIIFVNGVAIDPKKITTISKWPTLENVTQLRSFLGLTGYYRRFIKNYGYIKPLFQALQKGQILLVH